VSFVVSNSNCRNFASLGPAYSEGFVNAEAAETGRDREDEQRRAVDAEDFILLVVHNENIQARFCEVSRTAFSVARQPCFARRIRLANILVKTPNLSSRYFGFGFIASIFASQIPMYVSLHLVAVAGSGNVAPK
jgi:hypothetical protein